MSKARLQQKAPAFKDQAVFKGEFKEISLDDYKGKYLVLFFYPLDFTFVCPTEIIAFSNKAAEFKKIGCEIVGVSIDSKFSHYQWTQQPRKQGGLGEMEIPLLSDVTKKISSDYGCLITEGPDAGLACRATFIIDPKQNLRVIQMNDLPIGRNVEEVLRLVEAIQFHEANGEVCPANWQRGGLTMKDDIKESKKYFEKVDAAEQKRKAGTTPAASSPGALKKAKK